MSHKVGETYTCPICHGRFRVVNNYSCPLEHTAHECCHSGEIEIISGVLGHQVGPAPTCDEMGLNKNGKDS